MQLDDLNVLGLLNLTEERKIANEASKKEIYQNSLSLKMCLLNDR